MSLDLDDEEDDEQPEWMQMVTAVPAAASKEVAAAESESANKITEDPAPEAGSKVDEGKDGSLAQDVEMADADIAMAEAAAEAGLAEIPESSADGSEKTVEKSLEDAVKDPFEEAAEEAEALEAEEVADEEAAEVEAPAEKAATKKATAMEQPVAQKAAVGEAAEDESLMDEDQMEEAMLEEAAIKNMLKKRLAPETETASAGVKRSAPAERRADAGPAAKRVREADKQGEAEDPGKKLAAVVAQLPTAVRAKFQILGHRMALKVEAAQALLKADAKDGLVVLQALAMREKVQDPTRFVVGSLQKRLESKGGSGVAAAPRQVADDQSSAQAGNPKAPKIVRSKSGSAAAPMASEAVVPKAKVAKTPKASSQAPPAQSADDDKPRPPAAPPMRPPAPAAAKAAELQARASAAQKGRVVPKSKGGAAKPPATLAAKPASGADDQEEEFDFGEEETAGDGGNDVAMSKTSADASVTAKNERKPPASTVMDDLVRSPSAASRTAPAGQRKVPEKRPAAPSKDDADADLEDKAGEPSPEKPPVTRQGKPPVPAKADAAPAKPDDDPAKTDEADPWDWAESENAPKEKAWGKSTAALQETSADAGWKKPAGNSWDKPAGGGAWNKPAGASWGKPDTARIAQFGTQAGAPAPAPAPDPNAPPKKKWSISSAPVKGRPGAPPQKREGLDFEYEAVQEKLIALNDSGIWTAKVAFDDAALAALLKVDAGSALDILADAEQQGRKCRFPSLFIQQQTLKVRTASKG